ncbi:Thioredoxin-related protein [Tritonibacter multivorans]|uniref:Thioredoxin-related protein n=1 Tax=Tritonibacter multivorans TaxID=928856 RepID=A0A0P1GJ63_9RHOB|nr:thioredoxin family protein [Tritonibacter multivorans]MDA7421671.1 thioredoxin family protein [Tritonibacter multivorans]CUH81965.1 Thioredoxin-related protein [Tritonibacter multivorans]SFC92017.1 Thioredoxin-like domain-containing protein [Tritonibacter multivorans]
MRHVFLGLSALITATCITATGLTAAELGDDGLHKAPWMRDTFKDLGEDLAEANAEGKRLMILIEQRGCIYCKKMHEEVFVVPEIAQTLEDHFFVVQINMFGDVEVTDFDGTVLAEKDLVKRWGALFTPNLYFFPEAVAPDQTGAEAAVVTMPGAFGRWTTLNLLHWVLEQGYVSDEPFQKYHARKFEQQKGQ